MRAVIWAVCLLVALAACKDSLRREITFTAAELQAKVAKRFPLERKGQLAKVKLRNPNVLLELGSDRIGFRTDVQVKPLLGGKYQGTMSFDAGVGYNPDKGEFYLVDSQIRELVLDEVPDQYQKLVRDVANQVLGRYLDELAVYRLDPDDFEESVAKLVLKEVAVRDGKLVLSIGLI